MYISFPEKKLGQFGLNSEIRNYSIKVRKIQVTVTGHWFTSSQQVVYTSTRGNSADTPRRQVLQCWLQRFLFTLPHHCTPGALGQGPSSQHRLFPPPHTLESANTTLGTALCHTTNQAPVKHDVSARLRWHWSALTTEPQPWGAALDFLCSLKYSYNRHFSSCACNPAVLGPTGLNHFYLQKKLHWASSAKIAPKLRWKDVSRGILTKEFRTKLVRVDPFYSLNPPLSLLQKKVNSIRKPKQFLSRTRIRDAHQIALLSNAAT